MTELVLVGINGGNPLGFLAALGTILMLRMRHPEMKLSWRIGGGVWQPIVHGYPGERGQFAEKLLEVLKETSPEPFEVDKKLPFSVDSFTSRLRTAQTKATFKDRRMVDFLSAFGTEVYHAKGFFHDTALRMTRSGDSSGQGLPAYALAMRKVIDSDALKRTLFKEWSYQDEDVPILRWDPVEDQRYALVWNDPQDKGRKQIKSMLGANTLAIEALPLFPVMPTANGAATTGFCRSGRYQYFTWPIWNRPVSVDVIRTLLSLSQLHEARLDRQKLDARGIVEIYRCQRIAPSDYYRNFTPAVSCR